MSQTPIGKLLDEVKWELCEPYIPAPGLSSALPHVTHTGILNLLDFDIKVVQLSNGERIIPADSLNAFMEHMAKYRPAKINVDSE